MSNPIFFVFATGAVLLALGFVLVPLAGSRHRAAMLGLAILIPAASLAIYSMVGTPAGVAPDTGETGQVRTAVTELARRAMREPDEAENWARLGLAYKRLEEFSSAEHAFRRTLYIDSDAPFITAELGETLLYASGQRQLPEEARALLEDAAQDSSQKALWLLGLDAFQREAHAQAATHFERLLELLPGDSSVRDTVEQYLATARRGGSADDQAQAGAETALAVAVDISDSLSATLQGDETVFVAVRRAEGGPPLAVRRFEASRLPAELTIDDSDAMLAGNGLSSADSIVVVARVSMSGDATARPGDFQGQTDILPLDGGSLRAEVIIDRVL